MARPTLYLMLGVPGAGKTTTAKHIASITGAERLSSDEIRVEMFGRPTFSTEEHDKLYKEIDERTETLLKNGHDVIYDANLNRYQHRKEKYEICDKTGARCILIWRKTPTIIAKLRAQVETRTHLIPPGETAAEMFDRIASIIEPPREYENAIILEGENISVNEIKAALNLV